LPVDLSFADTFMIPLASISKVTSTYGCPLGAIGIPPNSKSPKHLLSTAISLSPWNTLIETLVWLSTAVESTYPFFVGIVVLRWIRRVNTPPRVSIPRDSGVTSNSKISLTSPVSTAP